MASSTRPTLDTQRRLVVQGMRTAGPSRPKSDWRWVLTRRLRKEHHLLRSGEKTIEAEVGLGLTPCAYFYVGRCEPEFSDHSIAFEDCDAFEAGVSPFDSGGLWFGHVVTNPPLGSQAEVRSFLELHTLGRDAYGLVFEGWLSTNYGDPTEYVDGAVPVACFAPEVEIAQDSDARSWTWEMRVPMEEFPVAHLRPVAICLSLPRFQQLTQWIIDEGAFSMEERADLLSLVTELHVDPLGLGAGFAMNEWVKGAS